MRKVAFQMIEKCLFDMFDTFRTYQKQNISNVPPSIQLFTINVVAK